MQEVESVSKLEWAVFRVVVGQWIEMRCFPRAYFALCFATQSWSA